MNIAALPNSVKSAVLQNLGMEVDGIVTEIPADILVKVNGMSAREVVRCYAEWHLGDGGWADLIIDAYESALSIEVYESAGECT
jgi:hypothetical protein